MERRAAWFCMTLALVLALTAAVSPIPAHAAPLTWVIGPKDDVSLWGYGDFCEGLASICVNGKYGFIDKTGKTVIAPQFSDAYGFSDGLAAVEIKEKWGYIDKTGKLVIPAKFASADPFSEGYALVKDDTGDYQFIDKAGNTVIRDLYIALGPFSEGLAPVETEDYKTGFINTSGAYVIQPTYDSARSFSEGLAPAKILGGIFGKTWGYIDKTGKFAFAAKFGISYRFSDGLARVVDDVVAGGWGFINRTGAYEIPPTFSAVGNFSEGLAPAELNGKWGYIDKQGDWVIEPQFLGAGDFSEGLASVETSTTCGFIANPLGMPVPKDEPDTWALEEVNAAIAAGLVPENLRSGYKTNIIREDFCRLAVNLIVVKTGSPIADVLTSKSLTINTGVFSDTEDQTILAANALGIVGGKGNGIFDPKGSITRQEAAAMLMRTAKVLGYAPGDQAITFGDTASLQAWAKEAIAFISAATDPSNSRAVMGGTGGSAFSPTGTYTRQQAFMTMIRLFNAIGVN